VRQTCSRPGSQCWGGLECYCHIARARCVLDCSFVLALVALLAYAGMLTMCLTPRQRKALQHQAEVWALPCDTLFARR